MNEIKQYPLSLNGDTFNALKSDFEQMLRQLLTEMEKRDSEDATMTVKLNVELKKDQARDYLCNGYDGTRDITKPSFKHEISTVMQVKNKKTGSLGGNYELVWDKDLMQYVMREIDNGQISMFNEKKEQEEPVERPALPDGNVIDADYEEVLALPEAEVEEDGERQEEESAGRPDVSSTVFGYMLKHVGEKMRVCVGAGIYTVRSEKNSVVLSSAFPPTDPFFCPEELLSPHEGHSLSCEGSPSDEDEFDCITIWCDDCEEKIFEVRKEEVAEDVADGYDYPVDEAE